VPELQAQEVLEHPVRQEVPARREQHRPAVTPVQAELRVQGAPAAHQERAAHQGPEGRAALQERAALARPKNADGMLACLTTHVGSRGPILVVYPSPAPTAWSTATSVPRRV
jgi:hypothetical protein